MAARPTSVTVIGWILIVFAAFGFLSMLMLASLINSPLMQQTLAQNPLPPMAVLITGFVGTVITLLCGLGSLKRWGWVRYVYLVWSAASLLLNFFTSPYSKLLMLPSVVLFVAVAVVLFMPASNAWFAGKESSAATVQE